MKKNIFAALFFALGLAVLPLSAEVMTYQGRLKESNLPVSDTRYFDFAFCNASDACTPTPTGVQPFTVTNGLFKSTFTVPGVILSQGEWTLRVSIGATAGSVLALSPRERLTAVPYSVYASSAGNASALAVNSGEGVIASTNVIVLGGLYASDTALQVSTHAVIQGFGQLQNKNPGEQDVRVGVSGRVTSNSGDTGDIMAGGNFETEVPTGKNGIMIGMRTATSNSGSSPRAIGLLVDSLQNSGTITDTYGLWIATLTQGTQSNKPYAVYSEDAGARTYFAGSVGIGTSTPVYALAVSSGAGEAGTIMAVSTGSSNLFWVTGDGAHATSFWGDGSGLTGVTGASGTDATKVLKAGDTMTGPLTAPDYAAIYGVTASSAVFSSGITASSYTATGDGLSAARVLLAENVAISAEASSALGSGVRVSTNLYIVGFSSAARYYGDGSGLTGVTAGAVSGVLPLASGGTGASNSDNARLNLNAVSLAGDTMTGPLTAPDYAAIYGVTASSAVFSSGITASSYTATGYGLSAAKVLLAENVAISAEASSALGSGVRVSTNLYIVGFSSAAIYYGDGSGLTGVTGATGTDPNALPLSGGTMTGNLNMGGRNIYAASTITASGNITAARYQINGSTVLAVLSGAGSLAVGLNAGVKNTGATNSFVGYNAGFNNTTGAENSFIGYNSGYSNTIGAKNIFAGNNAGHANNTGSRNTLLGINAGKSGTSGTDNSLLGAQAGYYNLTGSANSVVGEEAGFGASGQSFSSSTIMGFKSGFSLTTGSDNLLLGFQAGSELTSGGRNVIIGYNQDASAATASNELNIGGGLYGNLSSKTIGISTRSPQAALDIVSTGITAADFAQIWRDSQGSIKSSMSATGSMMAVRFVGDGSGLTGVTGATGTDDTRVLKGGDTMSGDLLLGGNNLYSVSSVTASGSITAAHYQIGGSTALAFQGIANLLIGDQAGLGITSGDYNTMAGYRAGKLTATGQHNVFVGQQAGALNTGGDNNSFYGSVAGYGNTTGVNNSAFGTNAGYFSQVGSANTLLGQAAGRGSTGFSYSSSTLVGANAGYSLKTGSDNIFLGYKAGFSVTTGSGNIVIGYAKELSADGANNELNIGGVIYGDLAAGTIGISTRIPQAALDIVSTGITAADFAQIWRDSQGSIKSSMSATGVMMAGKFVGDGSNLYNLNADMVDFMHSSDLVRKSDDVAEYITGAKNFTSSLTVSGSAFSVGGSTLAVTAGRVGINTTDPAYLLHVKTNSGSMFVSTDGTTGLGNFAGVRLDTNSVVHVAATLKDLNAGEDGRVGLFVDGRTSGSSNLDFLAAANFEVTSNGADSASYLIAQRAKIRREVSGSGEVVNAIGLFVDDIQNDVGAGVITNTYAIFIGTQTGGSQTNTPYALYSADSNARAYFGGKVGIGTSDPKAMLDVVSDGTTIDDYAQIWRNSNGNIVASMTATGQLSAGFLTDTSKVSKSGDMMYGDLSMSGKSIYFVSTITAIGDITAARYQINGTTVLAVSPGTDNLFVGANTGNVNAGNYNAFLGAYAGSANTTGGSNSFVGYAAGGANTTGGSNSFIGWNAGSANTTAWSNSFVGYQAGRSNTTGERNSYIGANAGYYNLSGSANSMIGYQAGNGVFNTSYSSSTLMGYQAGFNLGNGADDNIFLGFKAGYSVTTGTGNIIIGYNKSASAAGANNELNIGGVLYGNLASGNIGIGASNPNARLEVSGIDPTLAVNNTNPTAGTAFSTLDFRYSGVSQAHIRKLSSSGDFQINAGASGSLSVFTGSNIRFIVGSDGNVGINTQNPTAARLHVVDNKEASGTGFGLSQLQTGVKGVSTAVAAKIYKAGLAGYIGGSTPPTYAAGVLGAATDADSPSTWGALGYLDGSSKQWAGYFTGSVGVAKPAETSIKETLADFTVSDNTLSYLKVVNNSAVDNVFAPVIQAHHNGTGAEALVIRTIVNNDSDGNSPMVVFDSDNGGGDISYRSLFEIRNNNVAKVTVSSGGNVGIGITRPISSLQVNGDLGLGDDSGDKNTPIVIWLAAATGINVGDVVVASGSNQAAAASAAADSRVIGVAYENISVSSWGRIVVGGVATVNCTAGFGGEHAVTSLTTGNVSGTSAPGAATSIGVFLTSCGTPIAGKARLLVR